MRVCVDLNVWIQDEFVQRHGRGPSAASRIVDAVRRHEWNRTPLQLVMSVRMLSDLRNVLVERRRADPQYAELYIEAIEGLMRLGPEKLDPHLILAGSEQFAIADREDRDVMAVAMAARADLLITSNLRHFLAPKCEAIVTRTTKGKAGARELHVQIHPRPSGGQLIVADPVDAVAWLDEGVEITAGAVRSRYKHHKRLIAR
jgi:predicted nucleic acid-binding protein